MYAGKPISPTSLVKAVKDVARLEHYCLFLSIHVHVVAKVTTSQALKQSGRGGQAHVTVEQLAAKRLKPEANK